jgi:hypothetical protein
MAEYTGNKTPDPTPMHILLVIAIGFCAFFFWIGTVCVRLWFYKGALGPAPEKFIIIPFHWKKKSQQQLTAPGTNRVTFFPEVAHTTGEASNPVSGHNAITSGKPYFRVIPAITVEDADKDYNNAFANDFEDPDRVREYIAKERRISRLPAFEQDDCGDGSEFPEVPYTTKSIEAQPMRGLRGTVTYLQLGLHKLNNTSKWLTIENSYMELHEARALLLDRTPTECVQVKRDSEAACEELLDQVVHHLCIKHPDHFNTKMKHYRKHIRK